MGIRVSTLSLEMARGDSTAWSIAIHEDLGDAVGDPINIEAAIVQLHFDASEHRIPHALDVVQPTAGQMILRFDAAEHPPVRAEPYPFQIWAEWPDGVQQVLISGDLTIQEGFNAQ